MDKPEQLKRSKAGGSTLRQHRKNMLPWSYFLFAALLIGLSVVMLFLFGVLPLWIMLTYTPLMFVAYRVWDRKTDPINDRWGEGARGEVRVGRELEKLYREGFHVFHDWDKGRGNVDHFAVEPQGVFAVETKAWTGEITSEDGRLKRNGFFVYENRPVKQAMGNAFAVRELVGESYGKEPFVVPLLCFSRAEVRCYRAVKKVEVTSIATLGRVIMDRPTRYNASEVCEISQALEKKLGVAPAVRPGFSPERLFIAKRILEWLLGLSRSATALLYLVVLFAISLAFPATTWKLLLGAAYLYYLLSEMSGSII